MKNEHMVEGREILLGVSGGIAAYKAAALASLLVQQGARVTVVMSARSQQFVGRATFAALTSRPVETKIFSPQRHPLGAHIELAEKAELFCIAPASADFLAKAACGIADDLMSTLLLCVECPVLMAPAMNASMWAKASVQRNIKQVQDDGVEILAPSSGWLSCRTRGPGRMQEPEAIAAAIHLQFQLHCGAKKT